MDGNDPSDSLNPSRYTRHSRSKNRFGSFFVGCPWCLPITQLLGQRHDDAFGSANVGESIRILVLHFTDKFSPVLAQTRDNIVNILDGEHNAPKPQRIYRRIDGTKPDRVGRVVLVQLDTELTIGSPQHREGSTDILESN